MRGREVAWRLFATEFNRSNLVVPPVDEFSPTYMITPLGAEVNRVMFVGVLTELQKLGTEEEPYWKMRVADPTGTFRMNAGQYQPEVVQVIPQLEVPCFVAVIGKVKPFTTTEGDVIPMVRPETVIRVDKSTRDPWLITASKSMVERLDIAREAFTMAEPTRENLEALGCPRDRVDGLLRAIEHYDDPVLELQTILVDILKGMVDGEYSGGDISREVPKEEPADEEKEEIDVNALVLQTIVENEDEKEGILEEKVIQMLEGQVDRKRLETAIEELMDEGDLYTPTAGHIKSI